MPLSVLGRRPLIRSLLLSPLAFVRGLFAKPQPAPLPSGTEILKSFDASDWAKAFVEHVRQIPGIATDEETMTGWFANALMRGYDEARHNETVKMIQLREENEVMLELARALPAYPVHFDELVAERAKAINALDRLLSGVPAEDIGATCFDLLHSDLPQRMVRDEEPEFARRIRDEHQRLKIAMENRRCDEWLERMQRDYADLGIATGERPRPPSDMEDRLLEFRRQSETYQAQATSFYWKSVHDRNVRLHHWLNNDGREYPWMEHWN